MFTMGYVPSPHTVHLRRVCVLECMCDTSVTALAVFQDTVSVHRPSFYADRFLKFMGSTVFRKLHRKTPPPPDAPPPQSAIPANISNRLSVSQLCEEPLPRGRRVLSTPASRPRRRLCPQPRRRRRRRRKPRAWNSWTQTVSTKQHFFIS